MEQYKEKINLALSLSGLSIALAVLAIIVSFSGSGTQQASTGPEAFFASEAKSFNIRTKNFEQCLLSDEAVARVDEDEAEALALSGGSVGTPYSMIMTENGAMIPVSGALPYDLFEIIINLVKDNDLENLQELYNSVYANQGEIPQVQGMDPQNIRAFDQETDHYQGNPEAAITIIEYSDLECPYCARAHETFHQLVASDLDILWVYRHLPLTSIHPQAKPAAIAAECIDEEAGPEAFWTFIDTIFKDQSVLQN